MCTFYGGSFFMLYFLCMINFFEQDKRIKEKAGAKEFCRRARG